MGDLVLEFDHQAVTGPAQFAELVGQSPMGATVELALVRGGRPATLRLTLDRRDIAAVSWMREEGTHTTP